MWCYVVESPNLVPMGILAGEQTQPTTHSVFGISISISVSIFHLFYHCGQQIVWILLHPSLDQGLANWPLLVTEYYEIAQDSNTLFFVILYEYVRHVVVFEYRLGCRHGQLCGVEGFLLQHLHKGNKWHQLIFWGSKFTKARDNG